MRRPVRMIFFLVPIALLVLSTQNIDTSRGIAGPVPTPATPAEEVSFRIILGTTDTGSTPWDGSVIAKPGVVVRLEPWRFDEGDALEGTSRWKLSTHQARVFGAQAERPIVANGVVATFRNLVPGSEVRVETVQGNFLFRPAEVPYGITETFLGGRVSIDRVPSSVQVTRSSEEQDYPASAVDREGNVWMAYMQFSPNPKFHGIRMSMKERPKNFDEFAEPTGGDQIFVSRYSRGVWSEPVAMSDPRGDLYRPAVAVDGSGRVWVFWSANNEGNFDLYARPLENGKAGKILRLSTDRGADVNPVATVDARGDVWVAWQGFRGGQSQILAAYLQGTSNSASRVLGPPAKEFVLSSSKSNEWNPAIAASPTGEIAVAWDSYRNGNYDVYFRTVDSAGRPGTERQAAASALYEAYPSIAYDPSGRLWVAWEESNEGWGKDYGAYETTGIAIYQGRWIRVRVFQGERIFAAGDLSAALPGVPNRRMDSAARQADLWKAIQPDPSLTKNRAPSRVPQPPPRPMNSYPRLLIERSGRVWLAYRTAHPIWWSGIGTVWFENVVSFDGGAWSSPVFIPHSDNLLDNRPALASSAPGELLLVGSSDGRQQYHPRMRAFDIPGQAFELEQDPYNNDLYASRILLREPVSAVKLQPSAMSDSTAQAGKPDTPQVSRLREYRLKPEDTEYRILRGEFHRHTEISMDGGRDGSLWDAWRYALDAAALDWIGCCDHDNGFGREYSWWITQKLSDVFLVPGTFTPMFNYERSIAYPEGHRNVIFARRGIRTLPRLPKVREEDPGGAPDTKMLYGYVRHFNGIVASHTSATNMGTDWRDNDPLAEPVVEIYQGDRQNYEMPDAPRSNSANDSIGGWRAKGFVSLALEKGYRLGFQASSDHISTHMSYCNLYARDTTREAILEAFQKRRVYGATDDILADVRSGTHLLGEAFETSDWPSLAVKLAGTAPFSKVHVIKDNRYVFSAEPKSASVEFSWKDLSAQPGKTSYYYIRGEQEDGEIVWTSPMWITYRAR